MIDNSASATDAYARIYEEQQPRLVAYARSLTKCGWAAEDLVAEAHFRVWRRLSAGHEIDNVPAYLMTTVRHLAATTAGSGPARETPHDPQDPCDPRGGPERAERVISQSRHTEDPAEQVSSVDLLVRVLGQLPDRWVKALWLAEAEGQPLAAIGPQIGTGTKEGATAVLLHRAREGMRQAFLREQPGVPGNTACQPYWVRMPAYVRGTATRRQSDQILAHTDTCDDCRHRLALLMRTNDRLPALVGPALLVLLVGGTGKYLLSLTAASAAAGHGGGALHAAHAVRHAVAGGAKVPKALALSAGAAATAVAITIALTSPQLAPQDRSRVPLADGPVAPTSTSTPAPAPPEVRIAVGSAVTRVRGSGVGAGAGARTGVRVGTGTGTGTGVGAGTSVAPAPPVRPGHAPGAPTEPEPPAPRPPVKEPVPPVGVTPGPPVPPEPPVVEPPVVEPPVVEPPVVYPPVVDPPVVDPPVSEPPVVVPPVVEPPVVEPPVVEPTVPVPPVVVPPAAPVDPTPPEPAPDPYPVTPTPVDPAPVPPVPVPDPEPTPTPPPAPDPSPVTPTPVDPDPVGEVPVPVPDPGGGCG
ncbi:sigma factor [Streptomyces graminilatus]|uniref:sigma factor n=1 Tax=Streptomyces graminilatus TaxID=1464070 RepID=UPI0006E3E42D|nr:sigma-70 family RNA polymerase sigma factor [Streptomyces graminilatus]